MRAFKCGLKVIFQNLVLKPAISTSAAIFLAINLANMKFLIFVLLNFEIFEKNMGRIENFKSGKKQIFLHFEKHGHLGNQICQVPMFLDFSFLHFPCKIKILNGHGSDVILKGNILKRTVFERS